MEMLHVTSEQSSIVLDPGVDQSPNFVAKCLPKQGSIGTAVRLFLAALLLAAAYLKAFSPTEAATLATTYEFPLWTTALLVQAEIGLAVLLIAGFWLRWTIPITAILFTAFAAFSLYRALSGAEACGCFGSLQINPWVTFGLDLAVLAGLYSLWSAHAATTAPTGNHRPAIVGGMYFLAAIPPLWHMLLLSPTTLSAESGLQATNSGLVILEPEEWIGKGFPLAEHLTPEVDCSTGNWIVLMYHHNCPKCQEALPEYVRLAESLDSTNQLLLIEVPPLSFGLKGINFAHWTSLSERNDWFVQTPVEILIKDGKVVRSSLELPSIEATFNY